MKVEFLSAVLLISKNHDKLAQFYKEVVGIPLEDEQHGETHKHYGCELGDLHFAIHPVENFQDENYGVGSVKLAFEVFNMEEFLKKLEQHGVTPLYAPRKMGPMLITAIKDPDGNLIEFTQLGASWYGHLEKRRTQGHDIIQRWKAIQYNHSLGDKCFSILNS
jgi:catechol 2,3-dioxygenase-like lactoylglutathione lyase family enzyme